MVHSQCLKPINKILWVVKSGVETIDAEQICIERVGEKAFGLASFLAASLAKAFEEICIEMVTSFRP